MALKLRVISDHYQQLGKQSSRLFGVSGGRIGRSADNDWILPDPNRYISSHHAAVRYDAGRWLLEDTSTNGIFMNGEDTPLSQMGPRHLQDGDRLRMGDYDILVSINEKNDFPPDATGQAPQPPSNTKPLSKAAQRAELEELNVEIDINDLLTSGIEPPVNFNEARDPLVVGNAYGMNVPQTTARTASKADPQEVSLDVAPMLSSAAGIDWHLRTRRMDPPPNSKPVDTHNELNAGLEAFCRGAGIDPNSIAGEAKANMLTLAGQMMREVALGLMEANKARGDIKTKIDAGKPQIQPTDNNPLKVASSVDDAMKKLLDPQNTRYLGPVESIRDSFTDIRNHQQSIISAMHAALNSVMERLDPAELQDRFDRSLNRGGLMSAANKLKYWDMYAEFFQVINQRNSDGLPMNFADEFAETYTERMAGFRKSNRRF